MRRGNGFTLVELLLVLFLVALLAGLVMPVATKSVAQAKESALKEDLQVLRKAIDDYYANTGHYPESLAQLADKHYIRKLPVDPLTDVSSSWVEVHNEGSVGGVVDVHSGAEGAGSDGRQYRDW
ncbi:MAG TPA: prepilin-type N-terminal cleavage/methylation domain-containing protein [Gallionella sp.]|nr:prepilin-type N-terminal cleavage/methylation domain-containing protein [Gallionella sp.]